MNISDKYKLIFFHLPKCAGKSVVDALDIKTNDKSNNVSNIKQTISLGIDLEQVNIDIYPKKWDSYIKFTVVRNPWDKVVSLYHFRKKENDLYKMIPEGFGMNMLGGDKVGPDGEEWDFKRWVLSGLSKGLTPTEYVDGKRTTHLDFDSKTLEEAIKLHELFLAKNNYRNLIMDETEIPTKTPAGEIINIGWRFAVRDRIEWWNQIDIISDLDGRKLVDYILRFEHLEDMWNRMFEQLGHEPPKLPKKNTSKHKHYSEYYDDETCKFVGHLFKKDIETFGYEFKRI